MLVPLNSPEGSLRLEEARLESGDKGISALQEEIVASFRKQRGNTVCGLASLAVVLTARKRSLNYTSGDCIIDEDDVYPMAASNGIVSEEKIRKSGMTLDQIQRLAEVLPTTKAAVAYFPANPTTKVANPRHKILEGPHILRHLAARVLSRPSSEEGLVLNYHMSTLGQVPFGGHLSPVAAYHASSDSVLVMDVWHTQTEPVWASIDCVWESISVTDSESGQPRGLLHLVHKNSN